MADPLLALRDYAKLAPWNIRDLSTIAGGILDGAGDQLTAIAQVHGSLAHGYRGSSLLRQRAFEPARLRLVHTQVLLTLPINGICTDCRRCCTRQS